MKRNEENKGREKILLKWRVEARVIEAGDEEEERKYMHTYTVHVYRETRFEASHVRAGWPESEVDGRKRVGSLIQIDAETPEKTEKTVTSKRGG